MHAPADDHDIIAVAQGLLAPHGCQGLVAIEGLFEEFDGHKFSELVKVTWRVDRIVA